MCSSVFRPASSFGRPVAILHLSLALLPSLSLHAEEVQIVKERGPHQQRVETIRTFQDSQGNTLSETNSYVQLETGLNFRNAQGEWEESKAEFVGENGWAVARKGQHQVALYHNLNADGAVVLWTPEGKRLRSHVYGLAYYDAASGQSVLIASVKDSEAQLVADNQVVYWDAFRELVADVRYSYTKSGFEQDIILREQPPSPEQFGFNPATTRLEVWTEFVEAEQPAKTAQVLNAGAAARGDEAPLIDETLSFGQLGIGQGRTFRLGRESDALSLVAKNWIETDEGEKFLVETVALDSIEDGLQQLPTGKGGVQFRKAQPGRLHASYRAPRRIPAKESAQARIERLDHASDLAKFDALQRPGLVLDYVTTNGTIASYTFQSDETYYLSGATTISGASTFEGGTVLKLDSANTTKLELQGTVTFGGGAYRPVVFSGKDDNTVGQTISGSTGDPTATYYGATGGTLVLNNGTGVTLQHLRFSHQRRALAFTAGTSLTHIIRHAQFVRCQEGVAPANTVNLHNALFNNVGTVIAGTATTTVNGQHWTVNVASLLRNSASATLNLVNCLLVQFTTSPTGTYNDPYSSVNVVASNTGLFQTVSGGNHYLVAGSPYRNAGNANIDPTLAAELKAMTTEAPLVLTGTVNLDTTLSPRVARDTDTVDKGFHYASLDYVLKQLAVTAPLRLTNGVAVAVAGTHGADLQNASQFVSEGRAENLNRLTRWHNVQEQSASEGNGGPMTKIANGYGTRPVVSIRFTDLTALSKSGTALLDTGSTQPFASVTVEFCQSRNVGFTFWPVDSYSETVTLRNNLFERAALSVNHSYYSANTPLTFNAYNNLFWRGSLAVAYDSGTYNYYFYIKDNLFDGTAQTLSGGATGYVTRSNNGFISGTANTFNGTGDKTGLNTDYQGNGAWGYRYYPASGASPSLAVLIDAGSQTRTSAGLYHFTVKTANSSKEGADASTTVDIGFHYAGLNSSGTAPNDTDGDGLPDYVEDRDGDNTLDTGETNPAVSNGIGAGTAALLVFTPLQ